MGVSEEGTAPLEQSWDIAGLSSSVAEWFSSPWSLLVTSHPILGPSGTHLTVAVVVLCLHSRLKIFSTGAAVSEELKATSAGLEVACWQLSELLNTLL